MSFILDALKKAESERHRHVAPVLMDARLAPPRRGLPAWGWTLGIILLVNLAVLAWLLLRAPAAQPATDADPAAVAATPAAPDATSAAATSQAPAAAPVAGVAAAPQPLQASPAPGLAPADPGDEFSLPTAMELRGAGVALPALQLNMHIYDTAPAHRSVLLNGLRLREGEFTPDGVKVERITPQAVVLEAAGRRFRLDAGG